MPDGASATARSLPVKLPPAVLNWRGWLPTWSPAAAIRAMRATLVIPPLFALTDVVIGNLQMATFAAFGGFATLVLVSFGGMRRDKLIAHTGLALAGSLLLTIGTAVSSSTLAAALVTLPVGFAVFFAGAAGPNAMGGVTGALLAYVLPASSAGTMSMVPDRLAGWWMASVAGTAAVLVLSPPSAGDQLRSAGSKLASVLADRLSAALRGAAPDRVIDACLAAKHELLAVFTGTPYRPVGLANVDQALASGVELLEWCASLVIDTAREGEMLANASPADRELLDAACAVLRDIAVLLERKEAHPDIDGLERLRAASTASLGEGADGASFESAVRMAFHAQTLAVAVRSLAADALVASRSVELEKTAMRARYWYAPPGVLDERRLGRLIGAAGATLRNASVRSVWFVNSSRGALALAGAIAIAGVSNVQHAFWVVLGTLSVLRTNASATGSTALRALGGTVIGFAVGAALLLAIGTSTAALWVALVVSVLIAAYAPGTAPLAIGQASFTIVVVVLFNLLAPVGWKLGLLRIQDVAIGCGVSILAGALFWPRGVSVVVGNDLADVFRQSAAYLVEAVDWVIGQRAQEPDGIRASTTAAIRLDDALRGYLAEQGSKRIAKVDLWRLVGGSLRLRLTAHALAGLPQAVADVASSRASLSERTLALSAWYERLATYVGRPRRGPLTPLEAPVFAELELTASAPAPSQVAGGAAVATRHDCYAIWVREHLRHLSEHLSELAESATHLAEVRRRPWWR